MRGVRAKMPGLGPNDARREDLLLMIGISKLYCGAVEPADVLRYQRLSGKLPSDLLQFSKDKKPVVVWNCTRTCNLKCVHCYEIGRAHV